MIQVRYFDSQVFDEDSEIAQSEAEARGIFVRAFMDEHGGAYKAEVVRDSEVAAVVYYGVADEREAALLPAHQAAYSGVPFETVSRIVIEEGTRQRRKRRYDVDARMTEVVIETLDERGEPLVEVRRDPDGVITSRTEYEYDGRGGVVRAREFDGQGRLVDEYEAGE